MPPLTTTTRPGWGEGGIDHDHECARDPPGGPRSRARGGHPRRARHDRAGDAAARTGLSSKVKTLLAIVGPGLIVMVGDNDAGAFGTYTQAGQNYGTRLLWTLLLLVPVLYVNQEMVLRLGAVTGVGHARLILERFGKFWGAFSVIDLFILNALTIVTEFIGITLAAGYLGLPKIPSVALAAGVVIAAAFTGSFRRFERIAVAFCAGSLLLIPIYLLAHPAAGQMARDFLVPDLPGGSGQLATVMLLIIGIVGTTVAPVAAVLPAVVRHRQADHPAVHAVREGRPVDRHRHRGRRRGGRHGRGRRRVRRHPGLRELHRRRGAWPRAWPPTAGRGGGVLFAVALLDASIIGAFAVSLATAYAIERRAGPEALPAPRRRAGQGVLRGVRAADRGGRGHRADPRRPARAADRGRAGPGRGAAALGDGVPAAAVQRPEVLGPWVNGRALNAFTARWWPS